MWLQVVKRDRSSKEVRNSMASDIMKWKRRIDLMTLNSLGLSLD